jgi:hypothetical protein
MQGHEVRECIPASCSGKFSMTGNENRLTRLLFACNEQRSAVKRRICEVRHHDRLPPLQTAETKEAYRSGPCSKRTLTNHVLTIGSLTGWSLPPKSPQMPT